MADYLEYALDSEPTKHTFVPLADIESIETSKDKQMVIRLRKNRSIAVDILGNAEQVARNIMGGHFDGALKKGHPQVERVSASEG